MNLDGLNRWLTLGANVGVLIGLLLLAFELNQNRGMIRAQTRNEIAAGVMQLMALPAENPQLAAVVRRGDAGEQLTPDEHFQYRRFQIATFRYYENAHYQYRQGMYDEAEFSKQKEAWKSYAGRSPGSVTIWCEMRANFSADFVHEMDATIIGEGQC